MYAKRNGGFSLDSAPCATAIDWKEWLGGKPEAIAAPIVAAEILRKDLRSKFFKPLKKFRRSSASFVSILLILGSMAYSLSIS
jgi:hypothetical protein